MKNDLVIAAARYVETGDIDAYFEAIENASEYDLLLLLSALKSAKENSAGTRDAAMRIREWM